MKRLALLFPLVMFASPAQAATECSVYETLSRIYNETTVIVEAPDSNKALARISYLRSEFRFLSVGNAEILLAGRLNQQDLAQAKQFLDFAQRLAQIKDEGPSAWRTLSEQRNGTLILSQSRNIIGDLLCDSQEVQAQPTTSEVRTDSTATGGGFSGFSALRNLSIQGTTTLAAIILALVGVYIALKRAQKWWRSKQRRKARRYDVNMPIEFAMGAANHKGRLCDVSRFGGRIDHRDVIDADKTTLIRVFIAEAWFEGKVMWGRNSLCGINFNTALTSDQLKHIRKADKAGRAAQNSARPKTDTSPAT